MLDQSQVLVDVLKKKSARSLKKLMGVSDNIAELNVERFQAFEIPFTTENAKPAVLTFSGDVYTGLQADSFSEEDMQFAQKHLRILSGLYGLLKPMDLMQAYRLEMGLPLKRGRKKNLYEFWDTKITELLNQDLAANNDEIVINLASQEYFRSIKPGVLKGSIVHVNFKENRNGQYKVISFNAKKARGAMARQIIQNRMTDPRQLKELNIDGYLYNDSMSNEIDMLFVKE
jgi:cytoplasmic iron level regulating protein YaaA (DUF328/UPF0246 family)